MAGIITIHVTPDFVLPKSLPFCQSASTYVIPTRSLPRHHPTSTKPQTSSVAVPSPDIHIIPDVPPLSQNPKCLLCHHPTSTPSQLLCHHPIFTSSKMLCHHPTFTSSKMLCHHLLSHLPIIPFPCHHPNPYLSSMSSPNSMLLHIFSMSSPDLHITPCIFGGVTQPPYNNRHFNSIPSVNL